MDPPPPPDLIRTSAVPEENRGRPFEIAKPAEDGAVTWYRVFDDNVCGIRLAGGYLGRKHLEKLGQAISHEPPPGPRARGAEPPLLRGSVRDLRNDVAHCEPTPELMADARRRMVEARLWSEEGELLKQETVRNVLRDLGEEHPEDLCKNLVQEVRARLLAG